MGILDDNTAWDTAQQIGAEYTGQTPAESPILAAMGHMPAMSVTTGWNAARVQNTILKGGFNETRRSVLLPWRYMHGTDRGRMANHNLLRMSRWGKLSSVDNIHGLNGAYSPFDLLARSGNWLAGARGNASSIPLVGDKLSGFFSSTSARIDWDKAPFESGAYGKMLAGVRMAGRNRASSTATRSALNYISRYNDEPFTDFVKMGLSNANSGAERSRILGNAIGMSGNHAASQAASGFMQGVRGLVDTGTPLREIGTAFDKRAFTSAAEKGAKWMSYGFGQDIAAIPSRLGPVGFMRGLRGATEIGGKAATRYTAASAARFAGFAVPGLNVLMTAKLAYDLTSMGLSAAGGAMRLAKDSVVSARGTIDKPIMGMGFKDNEVAATSRARGVAAIQNSRLNARSVLGAEASSMAAHFG